MPVEFVETNPHAGRTRRDPQLMARNTATATITTVTTNHEVYSLDGLMIPIGRHAEFGNRYAEELWKECETKLGKDWWR